MTTVVLLVAWLAATPLQEQEKKIPSDSLEVSSRGCIKGRVFAAAERACTVGFHVFQGGCQVSVLAVVCR